MTYIHPFEQIDPIEGRLPSTYRLDEIARRARALLKSRAERRSLQRAVQHIDLMIDQFYNDPAVVQMYQDPDFCRGSISDTHALSEAIDAYDLECDSDFPGGQAFEYFAVLALFHAIDAALYLDGTRAEELPLGSWGEGSERVQARILEIQRSKDYVHDQATRIAMEGMEAVCWAEHLKLVSELTGQRDNAMTELRQVLGRTEALAEVKAKQKISQAAARNGAKAHTENRAMKQEAFAWFVEHRDEFPSLDKAAEGLAGGLVPVAFRTARKWIGEFNRELRSAGRV